MIPRIVLLLAIPACALAQLQVSIYDGSKETPVAQVASLAAVATGDSSLTVFHVRNIGAGAAALQPITVAGVGFSITSAPPYPAVIAPTNFVSFSVQFAPATVGAYSANVSINGTQFIITATAVGAPTLSLVQGSAPAALSAGSTVDFGRILKKTSATLQFKLSNTTTSALTVGSITAAGAGFSNVIGVAAPIQLAASQSVAFQIVFAPQTAGQYSGTLMIDHRAFALTGIAYDPPFPAASIVLIASAPVSGVQQSLQIVLSSASGVAGPGTVHLDFQSSVKGVADDPAIQFVTGGSRDLSFKINEGDTIVSFGSATDALYQTGTTAGTITFTVQIASNTYTASRTIAPAMVSVDTVSGATRPGDIDISISGFDNTRTAGQMRFTFYDTGGKMIQPGTISSDFTSNFQQYFASSQVGGAFMTRVTFPVTGDVSTISAVDVEMSNSAGTTRLTRITF